MQLQVRVSTVIFRSQPDAAVCFGWKNSALTLKPNVTKLDHCLHLPETSHDDVIGLQQAAIEKLFVGHLIHIHEQWLHITNVHISEFSQGVSCWIGNIEQTKSISWGLGGDGVSQVWSAVVRRKSGHYNLHNLHSLGDFICLMLCRV